MLFRSRDNILNTLKDSLSVNITFLAGQQELYPKYVSKTSKRRQLKDTIR